MSMQQRAERIGRFMEREALPDPRRSLAGFDELPESDQVLCVLPCDERAQLVSYER
jgi:hypothetical protein